MSRAIYAGSLLYKTSTYSGYLQCCEHGLLEESGVFFGIVLILLTSQYPEATSKYISDKFGVTEELAVSIIITSFIITSTIAFILVAIDYALDKAGYRFLVFARKKPELEVEYHPTRDRRVLDRMLGDIKTSGIFIGTELDIVLGMKKQLRDILIKTDATLSFHVLDPYDQNLIASAQKIRLIARGTEKRAPGNVIDFCTFRKELNENEARRLRLFRYKNIPIHSVILINRELDNAQIQVESYLHTVEGQNRPSLIIHRELQPDLFEHYRASAEWIIANSEEITCNDI